MPVKPKKETFDMTTEDCQGFVGVHLEDFIGRLFKHFRNHNNYVITGIVYMGKTDEWGIEHVKVGGGPKLVRPRANFFEIFHDGVERFKCLS